MMINKGKKAILTVLPALEICGNDEAVFSGCGELKAERTRYLMLKG